MNVSEQIRAARNKLQPTGGTNTDVLQFDYMFYTEMEKIAKKEREKALDAVKAVSTTPTKVGVILRRPKYITEYSESAPIRGFDLEYFLASLMKEYEGKIERVKLRELATGAVIPGNPRKSYKTIEVTNDE